MNSSGLGVVAVLRGVANLLEDLLLLSSRSLLVDDHGLVINGRKVIEGVLLLCLRDGAVRIEDAFLDGKAMLPALVAQVDDHLGLDVDLFLVAVALHLEHGSLGPHGGELLPDELLRLADLLVLDHLHLEDGPRSLGLGGEVGLLEGGEELWEDLHAVLLNLLGGGGLLLQALDVVHEVGSADVVGDL